MKFPNEIDNFQARLAFSKIRALRVSFGILNFSGQFRSRDGRRAESARVSGFLQKSAFSAWSVTLVPTP